MILWIVVALFILTGLLAGLRFLKKTDPFGGLDSEKQEPESVQKPGKVQ